MSSVSISRRQHPLFAWLLLLLLVCAVVVFGVLPALSRSHELTGKIESGYERLSKMRQIAQAAPVLRSEYERVRSQGLDKLFYSEGMTSAQVAKELQNQLTAVVTRRRGIMLSSEVMDNSDPFNQARDEVADVEVNTDYQRVTVQAVFQGDMQLLREILHETSRVRPLMFVEALEIRPLTGQQGQLVKASLQVSTYWRGGMSHETLN
ncbi:MAG: general secretion pathway protein GspM [Proteobacteria bacterium]|nr:MAG: general secretion pathway protein GspM [Pseudomonadota bacterium]